MIPHKLTLCLLLLFLNQLTVVAQKRKPPAGGRLAVVVDERLAALRATPQLNGSLVRRLSRGRMVAVRSIRTSPDGITFFLVNVTRRTHGWIQREAVVSPSRAGDDERLMRLIEVSEGFDQISRARIFLDHFPHSSLRPKVLLLLGDAAEKVAARLSQDAARRMAKDIGDAPEFSYYLNYTGLDRYNRQRVGFVFNTTTKRFHYDGAAWRELVRRYPKSPEAAEARKRLKSSSLATANSVNYAAMLLRVQKLPGESKMGLTHVAVKLRNRDSNDTFSANFLVDTGATDSMVPACELKRIGIKPTAKKYYELASGELAQYEVAFAEFSLMDETIVSRVIFGPDNAEPILGVLALEAVGVVVDPLSQSLKKLPALPLKQFV